MIEKEVDLSEVPLACVNCSYFNSKIGCTNEGECPENMPYKPVIRRPRRLPDN